MTLTRRVGAPIIETPNATMRTLASPTQHQSALAVWEVMLLPGASGPEHWMDADQVYVVLAGTLSVMVDGATEVAGPDDSIFVPRDAFRQIANAGDVPLTVVVSMPAGGQVSTPTGSHHGELPWAR